MKHTVEKKENGIYVANVSVSKETWNEAVNSAYEKNKGKYNVAGFRKGHAPRNVIEQNFGKGAFYNEALDEVYYKSYTAVLKENEEIKPVYLGDFFCIRAGVLVHWENGDQHWYKYISDGHGICTVSSLCDQKVASDPEDP